MNPVRFYCNPIYRPVAELDGSEAHHLAQVLRLKCGDKVELFDGAGSLATATVATVGSRKVALNVDDLQVVPAPDGQRIIIAASIAKGERFDWLIGKCTELGADRICPVLFERTVKQPRNPRTAERWRNIIIAAAKQCRRLFLPRIDNPLSLLDTLASLKSDFPNGRILLGSISPGSPAISNQSFGAADVIAFVGPEGGLTEQEEILLRENGAEPARLADTVLRIETAAVAFAAILSAQRIL